ncbi:meiotic nuclear division protein 1 [Venturia nashicola]|nr:meiotic nuclear division protein 1 [Venturia nashicola]
MNKKVHFRTNAIPVSSGISSTVKDAVFNSSKSVGKRKIGDTTRGMMPTKNAEKSSKRRKVSVFDAVAGRAGRNGFLATEPEYSRDRDTASSSTRPIPPDDILFSRKGARVRLADEDDYVGMNGLGPIPPNYLLETTHRYLSRFYDRPDIQRKPLHYKSMDGTALLALGILLEEALDQSLGETGHLAFLTAGEEEEDLIPELGWDGHAWVKKAPRRTDANTQSSRSALSHEFVAHDDLSEDEASEVVENEDDADVQDDWQSSSSFGAVKKIESRTESPQHIHERSPVNSRAEPLASLSSSSPEKIDLSINQPRSARSIGTRRPKRILDDEGYKSTAMVQFSDEDEDEAPLNEHDTEMADPEDSVLQQVSASPPSSTDSGSQSDSDREELETSPTRVINGRGNDSSRSASRKYRERSSSQPSDKSKANSRAVSEESSNEEKESSESEGEGAAAKATAPTHHDEPDHEPKKNTTREETSKASENRPEDKMAKFKKSMDDLLDRLMSHEPKVKTMAPKSLPPAAKQALIVQWIQKSGTVHSFKDLEKALPGVASINGMQVKEYIQAITDENLIRVEKIGSGNWYWSFLSDEKIRKEQALEKALADKEKAAVTVTELQLKVDEAGAEREDDEDDMLMEGGGDRKTMTLKHAELEKDLAKLRVELAAYKDNDPMEVENQRKAIVKDKLEVERYTEQIQAMEGWFKKQVGGDKEQMKVMKKEWYGDEYDEEEAALREL